MKILQFIYSIEPGGAERFVVDLSNALALGNNDIVLYTLRDDNLKDQGFYISAIYEKVRYVNLKINPGFKLWLIWKFYKILKIEKPNVVHCHLNLVNYFLILSILFHKKIKFVYTIHNSAQSEVKFNFERLMRRYCFKHNYFYPITISDETKKSYEAFYNLNNSSLIYNGRSPIYKSANFEKVVEEISALKFCKETLVFSHVSRCHETKNQRMLFSAFNKLHTEGFNLILLVIGQDYENAFDINSKLYKNIFFLGTKTNVGDYLHVSDAFCLSSLREGMPISLIEAMACGCVPICTPVGGCINVIENGVTGFLSKSLEENDYIEALKQFINHRDTIKKEQLMKFYKKHFTIEACSNKHLELYYSNNGEIQ